MCREIICGNYNNTNEIVTRTLKFFLKFSILGRWHKVLFNVSDTIHMGCLRMVPTIMWIIICTFDWLMSISNHANPLLCVMCILWFFKNNLWFPFSHLPPMQKWWKIYCCSHPMQQLTTNLPYNQVPSTLTTRLLNLKPRMHGRKAHKRRWKFYDHVPDYHLFLLEEASPNRFDHQRPLLLRF